jgi:hypothetical protein
MRKKNVRLVIVGVFLMILALVFFFILQSMAPKSLDPVALTQLAGQIAGVGGGLGLVLVILGLIGKKA